MSTLQQLSRTSRRLAALSAGALLAGTLVAQVPGASAAAATAVDCSTTYLQTAIDNALPGASLSVMGTCLGNYTIDKSLTLSGRGAAVLDGQHDGTTLTIASGASVQVAYLTITN